LGLRGSEGADATSPQLTHLQSYPQPVEKPVEKSQVPYNYLFIGTHILVQVRSGLFFLSVFSLKSYVSHLLMYSVYTLLQVFATLCPPK